MATVYDGPSGQEMLAQHTFAREVITRAKDPHPVLDDEELALLKRFVLHPESADDILRDAGLDNLSKEDKLAKLNQKGSLVTYVVVSAVEGRSLVTDGEMAELKAWFEGQQ